MEAQTAVPFVDTNVIPDRNAGMGSLLWDLQHPPDPERDGLPLLAPQFAFIDVGVSRAKVAAALKTLLAHDLGMDVAYVATELPEAVPGANVTLLGDRADQIRGCLSKMISPGETAREIEDWHYVVDRGGRVSSIAYSYRLFGNEVWESYFMGRTFIYSGEPVEFSDPALDEMLVPDVAKIEAGIDRNWDGYRVERDPLEAGLAASGITLQEAAVPRRIDDTQNVLFLGNVLNHYPHDQRAEELERVAASMEPGDLVIVQMDGTDTPSVEVLRVNGEGGRKTRERVRWINTRTLDIRQPDRSPGSWRQVSLKPAVERMVRRVIECVGTKAASRELRQEDKKALVQHVSHVLATFFRAWPVEETARIAIREAVRRLPSAGAAQGIPVFEDDATDARGGPLKAGADPILSEADLVDFTTE